MYNIQLKLKGESKQLDDLRLQTERQNLKIICLKDEIKSYKKEFKTLTNANSKLVFDSFIKEMRDRSTQQINK